MHLSSCMISLPVLGCLLAPLAFSAPAAAGILGDLNNDGYVTSDDLPMMMQCATRAQVPVQNPGCLVADFDGDNDVDPSDFGLMQVCMYAIPVPAECNNPVKADSQSVVVPLDTPVPITLTGRNESGGYAFFRLLTVPQHGALSGPGPDFVYTPAQGYKGPDQFEFYVEGPTTPSQPATISIAVAPSTTEWKPPVGIPHPPFGITEKPPAYDAANTLHYYVDNTAESATDSNNLRGTPTKPRMTLPSSLPAGACVIVRGGPYVNGCQVTGQGTASQPIWIVGIGMPRFNGKISVYSAASTSQYMVFQGLSVYKWEVVASANHVVLRDCEVRGSPTGGGVAIASFNTAKECSNIFVWNNVIRDNGDWQAANDQDVHGVVITARVNNTWILDNEMFHNSGDGLQINAGTLADAPTTHHIYVGGNLSYENKQAGLWTKQATDVIFSQNTCHTLRPIGTTPSAYGSGLGLQYAPERVWFLYNHVYNTCYGISSGSTSGLGNGQNCYIIGNLLHDIRHHPDYAWSPGSGWSNAAITMVGPVTKHIVNNTIYNVDAGINTPNNGAMYIANNIISNIVEPQGNHIFIEDGTASGLSTLGNCLFYQNGSPVRIRWGGQTRDLAAFQQATGKGAGCLKADPRFVNPAAMDFRLQAGSPAIDSGSVQSVYQTFYNLYGIRIDSDVNGLSRPRGPGWDMGAYEY